MKLAVFVSELRTNEDIIDRLKVDTLGIFLVGNGIYHAVIKEAGKTSAVLSKEGVTYYVLTEDLQTRGFNHDDVDGRVNIVTYDDVVDLIMNNYEKLIWL
jgi:sulfur relay protein TusB/DsrH